MMNNIEYLEIGDEDEEVIGLASRKEIHNFDF